MGILQASAGSDGELAGAAATGAGIDVLAALERVRSNLAALAQVVEEIRTKLNAHTHGGAVAAPPGGEQAATQYTLH